MKKPYKGRISHCIKVPCEGGLGFVFTCVFMDHPRFAGLFGHTSIVVKQHGCWVETLNSRYKVVGRTVWL